MLICARAWPLFQDALSFGIRPENQIAQIRILTAEPMRSLARDDHYVAWPDLAAYTAINSRALHGGSAPLQRLRIRKRSSSYQCRVAVQNVVNLAGLGVVHVGLLLYRLRTQNAIDTDVVSAHIHDANGLVAHSVLRKRIDECLDVRTGHIGSRKRRSLRRGGELHQQSANWKRGLDHRRPLSPKQSSSVSVFATGNRQCVHLHVQQSGDHRRAQYLSRDCTTKPFCFAVSCSLRNSECRTGSSDT